MFSTMSCIIHPINPGMKMYWSVQQCVKKSFFRNKNLHCHPRVNSLTNSYKSCAIIKVSPINTFDLCKSPVPSYLARGKDLTWLNTVSFCTKPAQDPGEDQKKEVEVKLSAYQKLKKLWKEYWYVLFPVHAVTSIIWYGSFYYLVVSGFDIPGMLESLGAPESWSSSLKNSQAGNLVLAYTLYKVATPLRYTVTLGGTTLSVNKLKQWGWIRPAPTAKQLKQMCMDKKEALKDLKATYQDKMQVTKDEFLKSKNAMNRQFAQVQEDLHRSLNEAGDELKAAAQDWRHVGKALAKQIRRNPNIEDQNQFSNKK